MSLEEDTPEQRERLTQIFEACPDVRVGDVWVDLWAFGDHTAVVRSFKDDSDVPWPLVSVEVAVEGKKDDVGLPAFKYAKLVSVGDGPSWKLKWTPRKKGREQLAEPGSEEEASPEPRTLYLDRLEKP